MANVTAQQSATKCSLAYEMGQLLGMYNQITMVTEAAMWAPAMAMMGMSATTDWNTRRTNFIANCTANFPSPTTSVATSRLTLQQMQDLIDKAPTLRFRGTP